MADRIHFPSPGCIVEYLENNSLQIAVVMEEAGGKMRLLLPSRREVKLASNRLMPWSGPQYGANLTREEYVRLMETHKKTRQEKAATISIADVWELAQNEITQAPASWFAELCEDSPNADTIAAYGAALLDCKLYFRFQSPDFMVLNEETVAKKIEEQKSREEREALIAGGSAFLRELWDNASKNRTLSEQAGDELAMRHLRDPKIRQRIYRMLHAHMVNPDTNEDETLWRMLVKGLPDVQHLPLQLLVAWGRLPRHYNFWLDRAAFEPGDSWWTGFALEVQNLAKISTDQKVSDRLAGQTFVSIDSEKTHDIDDAFHLQATENGWRLTVALACPALAWPFGSQFDKKILHRGTSIYLPEEVMHMLPQCLATDCYSLQAGKTRPALCISIDIDRDGSILGCEPFLAQISLAANLVYVDVQAILTAKGQNEPLPDNPATKFAAMLFEADAMARRLQAGRIARGAIIMDRPEISISLAMDGEETVVSLAMEEPIPDAQLVVSETMIVASSAIASWARQKNISLLYRTQNVTVPRECAGIWKNPADISRILRFLLPSILEVVPRPHAALAASAYAPITSPLRRYADLVNEGQILHYLAHGKPRWQTDELSRILSFLSLALEGASQAQKFRPRYWKLLHIRQQGDKRWWDAVITDENETFVSVHITDADIFVRGKRQLFDERATAGMAVRVRLGKAHPLYNELHILEAMPAD